MFRKISTFAAVLIVLSILLAACGGAAPEAPAEGAPAEEAVGEEAGEPVTLRVLVHQNPPMVEFVEAFNASFEETHPNVTVDLSVVNANDLSTVTQTRLTANDVDVIDMFAFTNAAEPYMVNVEPPNWQTLIEAGYLLDLTGQPFIDNY